ncbi:hypothetical protein BASA61_000324 [Batrachochytrium salamandrivorans]|nr:hypothetical protein BASA61_000324 [Batrachochytrium salamandrivorans]KAH9274867.1 hypothetical protein BASA83_002577 [Batrachochytrium salamandrivorans]KAJ1327169.1 hypothetical protein BSLG_010511 [Batrachochytrium salamandrivorans]
MVWHRVVTRANVAVTQTAQRLACIHVDQTIPWLMVAGKIELGCMHCLSVARKSPTQGLAYIPNTHARHYSQTSSKDLGNNPAGPIKSMNASVNSCWPSGQASQELAKSIPRPNRHSLNYEEDPQSHLTQHQLITKMDKAERLISRLDKDQIFSAISHLRVLLNRSRSSLRLLSIDHYSTVIAIIINNALDNIGSYLDSENFQLAELAFQLMLLLASQPRSVRLNHIADHYAFQSNINAFRKLLNKMIDSGANLSRYSTLRYFMAVDILDGHISQGLKWFDQLIELNKPIELYHDLLKLLIIRKDEASIKTALERMRKNGIRPTVTMTIMLAHHYNDNNDYTNMKQALDDFCHDGRALTTEMWNMLLVGANGIGDYTTSISLLHKMRSLELIFNVDTRNEEIVALAGANKWEAAWNAYSQFAPEYIISEIALASLANICGSMKNVKSTLRRISTVPQLYEVSPIQIAEDLITGYSTLGDIDSALKLISYLEYHKRPVVCEVYHRAIDAYIFSGSLLPGLDYAYVCSLKGISIPLSVYLRIYQASNEHTLEFSGHIIAKIRRIFPDVDIDTILAYYPTRA